jgi:hypothetical protein
VTSDDRPTRIVTGAANRLPNHRQDWGRAMAAELTRVHGRAHRWRFTAGVLRVALLPPPRHPRRVVAVAFVGLGGAVGATVAVARAVPSLSVFVGVLGLLLCGYSTVSTSRSHQARRDAPHVLVGVVALAGVAATVTAVVRTAVAHPAATTDGAHVFSVVFAIVLAGCLAFAFAPLRPGDRANTVLWWAFAGAVACGVTWTVAAVTTSVTTEGIAAWLAPVAAAATVVVAVGAAVTTGSRRAGTRAGILTVVLVVPLYFAVDVTAILHLRHYTLTNPYDVTAFAHSGFPDVASYVLSDDIAGNILTGLLIYPALSCVLALSGAVAGAGVRRGSR